MKLLAALVFLIVVEATNIVITEQAATSKWARAWLQSSSQEK